VHWLDMLHCKAQCTLNTTGSDSVNDTVHLLQTVSDVGLMCGTVTVVDTVVAMALS
jgi:hypothetical protein